jgi:hypothetical protein
VEISALEKLIKVVLLNEDPAKVEGSELTRELGIRRRPLDDFAQAGIYTMENTAKVKQVRIFKNDSLQITFAKQEYAEKVAQALLATEA